MITNASTRFFQFARFCRRVFMLTPGADAEGAHNFFADTDRHAQRAADAGLFRAGPGDAAGVGLQIAKRDRFGLRDDLSGNAFADGNGFYNFKQLRRQANLRDKV